MSNQLGKGNSLPPLQKRIILCLSEKGPQTINETSGNIQSHYKPTWIAFNSLNSKGLIKKVKPKEYRGREYPKFWLTDRGLEYAISNNANLALLLENVKKVYPNDIEKALFVELVTVDKESFMLSLTILKTPEIDISTAISFAIIRASKRLDKREAKERLRKLFMVLEKYPKYSDKFFEGLKTSEREISEVIIKLQNLKLSKKEGVES